MGKEKTEDQGLLEDLIGESLEGMEDHSGTGAEPGEDFFDEDTAYDVGSEDTALLNELGPQRTKRRGNRLLIFLTLILFIVGLVGAAVKFGFLKLPMPKFIYDAKKERKIDLKSVKVPDGMVTRDFLKEKARARRSKQIRRNPALKEGMPGQKPAGMAAPGEDPKGNEPLVPGSDPGKEMAKGAPQQGKGEPKELIGMVPEKGPKEMKEPPAKAPASKAPPPPPPPPPPQEKPAQAEMPQKETKVAAPQKRPRPKREAPPRTPPSRQTAMLGGTGGPYSVQVGAYLFESSLKEPMKKLVEMGFEPQISVSQRRVTMNRVLVGNFRAKAVAEAAVKDLAQEGIKAKIIQKPNDFYSALIGTFYYKSTASKMVQRLEEFGYDVVMDKVKVKSDLQELRVGAYPSQDAAEADLSRLKNQGLNGVIVKR